MKRRSLVLAAACGAVVAVVLCGARIAQVNAAYPAQHAYSYAMGEQATYAGQNSSGENVAASDITVMATGFRALDYAQLKDAVLGYADELMDSGGASDMRALLVDVEIVNDSTDAQSVHVRDFHLESGAWSNGLYTAIFMKLNSDPSTIVDLAPGERIERTLVYLMYDTQANSRAAWDRAEMRDYALELALYPDKYQIDLGSPAADGGEGGTA